jgi:uncharacterized membrane protein YeaQ/YmgE (transglycosylase-associated protein family)
MSVLMRVLVALVAGLLAGPIRRRGSYGRGWDVALGLTGSIVVSWLVQAARWDSPEPGLGAVTVVASLGAVGLIAAQRIIFPAHLWTPPMGPSWRADPKSDQRRDHGGRS